MQSVCGRSTQNPKEVDSIASHKPASNTRNQSVLSAACLHLNTNAEVLQKETVQFSIIKASENIVLRRISWKDQEFVRHFNGPTYFLEVHEIPY